MIDLTISIVTSNNKQQLKECLDSIHDSIKGFSSEVYVVDNHSNDGTKEMVLNMHKEAKLIINNKTMGFAYSHNRILELAKGKYAIILNDDTVILRDCFKKMINFLQENPEIGAIGPRMEYKGGRYQQSAFKFPGLMDFSWNVFFYRINTKKAPAFYPGIEKVTEAKDVDWLLGACLVVPKHIFGKVGLFDESFCPLYMEDADLCRRIKDAGYDIVYYPKAEIIHYGAQTTRRQKPFMDKILAKNRIRFFRKYYGIAYSLLAKCVLICANLLNRIIKMLKQ